MEVGVGSFEGFVCLIVLIAICIFLCLIIYYLKKVNDTLKKERTKPESPTECCRQNNQLRTVCVSRNSSQPGGKPNSEVDPLLNPESTHPGTSVQTAGTTTTITTYKVDKKPGQPDEITKTVETIASPETKDL